MKRLKRCAAALLAVSIIVSGTLSHVASAADTPDTSAASEIEIQEETPEESIEDNSSDSDTGGISEEAEETETAEGIKASSAGEEEEKPPQEEETEQDTYIVRLNESEHGILVFPSAEEPVAADVENPMQAMKDAIAQLQRQTAAMEQEYAAGSEALLHASADMGYVMTGIQAVSEETGEAVLELECDETGDVSFQMPEENIIIEAQFQPLEVAQDNIEEAASASEKARAAANKSLYLNVTWPSVWYGSYNTNYFYTNEGYYAYCLQPRRATPSAGWYTGTLMSNSYVRQAAYYSYGGPGYNIYKANYGNIGDGSVQYEYCYSHVIISYVYAKYYLGNNSEANYAFLGLSSGTKQALINEAERMMRLPSPPTYYSCYYISTGSWTQAMIAQTVNPGELSLKKSSANPAITNNNSMYSLAGAEYGVYSNSACTVKVATFTTDAGGQSGKVQLNPGTYYLKELKAPPGYELNTTVTSVYVAAAKSQVVTVSDAPINDPATLRISKKDAVTGEEAQGGASLAGAQFSVKYYAGLYTKESLPEEATKTWVIETKELTASNGDIVYQAELTERCKVSGDEFYYQQEAGGTKRVTIPRGTITIEETLAPEGYQNDLVLTDANGQTSEDGIYLVQIEQEGDMSNITGGSTFNGTDTVIRGDFEFTKKNGKTNTVMANIPFQITNTATGESHIVYTDRNGYFSSASEYVKHSTDTNAEKAQTGLWFGEADVDDSLGALPYGTYRIEELECDANIGLKLFKNEFKIDEDGITYDFGTIINNSITVKTQAAWQNGNENPYLGMMDHTYLSYGTFGMWTSNMTDNVYVYGMSSGYAEVTLYNPDTGKPLQDSAGNVIKGGKQISDTSSSPYVDYDGQATCTISFDDDLKDILYSLRGTSIVCGTRIYGINADGTPDYSRLYAVHEDMQEASETLTFQALESELTVKETGGHEIPVRTGETVLEDSVKFLNQPAGGFEGMYMQLTGTLVDSQGNPVQAADGTQVTTTTGIVQMQEDFFETTFLLEYTLPQELADRYRGQTLHSFLEAHYAIAKEGSQYWDPWEHSLWTFEKSLDNEAQAVSLPVISDTQVAKDVLADTDTGNTDRVDLQGLRVGNTYTLETQIVDKETGELIWTEQTFEDGTEEDYTYQYVVPGNGANYKLLDSDYDGTIFYLLENTDVATQGYYRINDDGDYVHCDAGGNQIGSEVIGKATFESILEPGAEFVEKKPLMKRTTFQASEADCRKYIRMDFAPALIAGKGYVVTQKLYSGELKEAEILDDTLVPDKEDKVDNQAYALVISETETALSLSAEAPEVSTVEEFCMESMEAAAETLSVEKNSENTEEEQIFRVSGIVSSFKNFLGLESGDSTEAEDSAEPEPILLSVHDSLNNDSQTFYIPKITTEFTEKTTGEHYFSPAGTAIFVDRITYSGMKPGALFSLSGQAVNKNTGAEVLTGAVEFTPAETDGIVEVEFPACDVSQLGGAMLVACETLTGVVREYGGAGKTVRLTVHNDMDDLAQTVSSMSITTQARGKDTGTAMILPKERAVIQDIVTYKGAPQGQTFLLEAVLMDKLTQTEAADTDGNIVTGSREFTAASINDSEIVELECDASRMRAGEYVVFERLYAIINGEKVLWTSHEDWEDEAQTVHLAGLDTNIYNVETMNNVAYPSASMQVRDIISYTGFEPGKTFVLEWAIYDVAKGALYKDATGKTVTKTQTFVPENWDDEFEIAATWNGSNLNGQALTAVTTITQGDTVILEHNQNLDNEYETLLVPAITTQAKDTRNGTQNAYAIKNASVTDAVKYRMLQAGMGHILKTMLVDKNTGAVLQDDYGNPLEFEQEFRPEAASGTYDAVLEFDGRNLLGKTVVVYQEIYMGDKLVAQEKDLDSASQTLHFVELGRRDAKVIKRMKASDFHAEHGNVTFLFRMHGMDLDEQEHTYYSSVTFTEDYVSSHTDHDGYVSLEAVFGDVLLGEYTVTEEETGRYCLQSITDMVNAAVEGDSVLYDLTEPETEVSATFTNRKYEWQYFGHTDCVINNIGE